MLTENQSVPPEQDVYQQPRQVFQRVEQWTNPDECKPTDASETLFGNNIWREKTEHRKDAELLHRSKNDIQRE